MIHHTHIYIKCVYLYKCKFFYIPLILFTFKIEILIKMSERQICKKKIMCSSTYINTNRSLILFLDCSVMNAVSANYAINLKTFISKYVSNHIKRIT